MAGDRAGQAKWPGKWKAHLPDAVALLAIAAPLCFLVWRRGGVESGDQVLAFGWVLGLTALACLLGARLGLPMAIPWAAAAVASLPLVQLLPVDLASWELASPLRLKAAEQLRELGVEPFQAVSVYPFATLQAATVVAGCCALFVIARAIARHAERAVWVALAPMLVISLVESGLGLHQYLRGQLFGDVLASAAHGTFVNRNHFSALLASCFGLAVGPSFASDFRLRRVWRPYSRDVVLTLIGAGAAVAYLVGIVLSFSRMGIVVAALVALASMVMTARSRGRALLPVASCAAAMGIAAAVGVSGLGDRFQRLVADQGDPSRVAIWRDSMNAAQDHLWTGSGLGTFSFAFRRSEMYFPRKTVDHAHCDYIEWLVELGLPAALFLAGVIGLVFVSACRSLRRVEQARRRALLAGCILGSAGLLLHAIVGFPLQMPALAGWFAALLGFACGLAARGKSRSGAKNGDCHQFTPRYSPIKKALSLKRIGWLYPIFRDLHFYHGLLARPGKLGRGIPGWAGALGALAFLGLGLFSISEPAKAWNAESLYARGQHALVADRLDDAQDLFAEALRANPRAALIWLKLAEVKAIKGDREGAMEMAELAGQLEPYTLRVEWALADLYLRDGRAERAAERLAILAAGLPQLQRSIFHSALSAGMTTQELVDQVVPANGKAAAECLRLLADRGSWSEMVPAYRALSARADFTLPPVMLRSLFDKLFDAGRGREIKALWQSLGETAGACCPTVFRISANTVGPDDRRRSLENLGQDSFGLDWVARPIVGVSVYRGLDVAGMHFLQVDFEQPRNPYYCHLTRDFAVVPLEPYLLEAEVSSQGITGSEGVRLAVSSHRRFLTASPAIRRTTPWNKVQLYFTPGPGEDVLRLAVLRNRSERLDRLISGKFLLRNVRLAALSGGESKSQRPANSWLHSTEGTGSGPLVETGRRRGHQPPIAPGESAAWRPR